MYDRFEVSLPIKSNVGLFYTLDKNINLRLKDGRPFIEFSQGENSEYTALKFLDAIRRRRIDDAMVYISKNYTDRIDLGLLSSEITGGVKLCPNVVTDFGVKKIPKNCSTNTFLLMDDKSKTPRVFRIYMLTEPDHYGKWKIYDIEQE